MSECAAVTIWINGSALSVPVGSVVSAAMLTAGEPCRISVSGEQRTALCGMGICFECRAVVNGVSHQRTCQLICREGMRVETQS
jgi:sarcosine oxidase subunit alpha